MQLFPSIKLIGAFLLGLSTAVPFCLFFAANQMGHNAVQALHVAITHYELASQQADRDQLLAQLNSAIACALDGYHNIEQSLWAIGLDDSYQSLVTKAQALQSVPCDSLQ